MQAYLQPLIQDSWSRYYAGQNILPILNYQKIGTNLVLAWGSNFVLQGAVSDTHSFLLRFYAVAGRSYRIEVRDTLLAPWRTWREIPAQPAGVLLEFSEPAGESSRFYRIVIPAGL